LLVLVESVLSVIAFSGVLWGISKPLVFSGALCPHRHLVTTLVLVNHLFGSTLNNSKEADFRFSLVRIRENAEAIAFTGAKSGSRTRSNSGFWRHSIMSSGSHLGIEFEYFDECL